jgi:hypothetical protein
MVGALRRYGVTDSGIGLIVRLCKSYICDGQDIDPGIIRLWHSSDVQGHIRSYRVVVQCSAVSIFTPFSPKYGGYRGWYGNRYMLNEPIEWKVRLHVGL